MQSYFDYINETEGGIDGRRITLDVKDDGYQPDKTKTNVDEALGSGDVRRRSSTILGTAEQPGRLGRPQRRVHAAAVQRHRGPALG